MEIKTSIRKNGGSFYMLLPPDMMKFLELEEGEDTVYLRDREKEFGRYGQFWSVKSDKRKR